MDEIVRAAIAKWPNVPHCYGWLALDARGNWRMRDERCQALNLQGFASALCHALAVKLMNDEQLQGALMDMVEAEEQPGEQAD